MFTQIDRPDLGIVQQCLGSALRNDLAFVDDVGTVTNIEGLADIMVGNQDTDTAVAQVSNDPFDVTYGNGIDPCKGFIQQHDLRRHGQGPGDLKAPSFPPGKAHGQGIGDMGNAQFLEEV